MKEQAGPSAGGARSAYQIALRIMIARVGGDEATEAELIEELYAGGEDHLFAAFAHVLNSLLVTYTARWGPVTEATLLEILAAENFDST